MGIVKKLLGSKNDREIKKLKPLVNKIAGLEERYNTMSDAELQSMTGKFKQRIANGESLDELLPEAFAVVREASVRTMGMRHYDVQMVGGIILHRGEIAEMRTGEGKTLVATLPAYLNALSGDGVHVVTVNDYLAKRDGEWMSRLHGFMGLSVGTVVHGLDSYERQANYRCDITYGQNNEFGFDYLRDNMKKSPDQMVQGMLNYAIVDEVDSILIDEARTPLIISGPAEDGNHLYIEVNRIIPKLKRDIDYTVDEKAHSVILTDLGVERVQKLLKVENLYDPSAIAYNHRVGQALKAHALYKRDKSYLVENGEVIIVDEHTGRKMPGRRWSDGLHQAIEAKEGVTIEAENQTLATVTFQNYFRMYNKLSGMTGTADTEAAEFHEIYKLGVSVIPTNRPIARDDQADLIFANEPGKFKAVAQEIKESHEKGQPVLVGTVSVQKSEVIAKLLKQYKLPYEVLNAKQHEREALVVAQAGRKGAITISTNMAGRGTDIVLGGNPEVLAQADLDKEIKQNSGIDKEKRLAELTAQYTESCAKEKEEVLAAGGLKIIGTERHESRRIDNQLRGRAGRQGDPGGSRFYLSFDDELMRIFISEKYRALMEKMGMDDDNPLEHKWVTKAIENAQKRVEGRNFDQRKNVLEYDDVMNQQRKTIYGLRSQILNGQYFPPLTEEEEKAGKEPSPPTASGNWTPESLVQEIHQNVSEQVNAVVDHINSEQESARAQGGELAVEPWRILAQEVWRTTGAWIYEIKKTYPEGKSALTKLIETHVAASLIQQRERLYDLVDQLLGQTIDEYCDESVSTDDWDWDGLQSKLSDTFNTQIELPIKGTSTDKVAQLVFEQVEKRIDDREEELSRPVLMWACRHYYLEEIDKQWIEHLQTMDQLREGIHLRGYGQKDPKKEYKKEGFTLFSEMMDRITQNVTANVFRVQLKEDYEIPGAQKEERKTVESSSEGAEEQETEAKKTVRRDKPKVGRNDPCPCGSGKKYKKCHGQAGAQSSI